MSASAQPALGISRPVPVCVLCVPVLGWASVRVVVIFLVSQAGLAGNVLRRGATQTKR